MTVLQPFEAWAQAQGADLAQATVVYRMKALWQNEKVTIGGVLCDEYVPTLAQVDLVQTGRPDVTLTDAATGEAALAFVAFATALQDIHAPLTGGSRLAEKGEAAPAFQEVQRLPLAKLGRLVDAEEAFMAALIADDAEALTRASFQRYQESATFARHPCDLATYQAFREEYLQSRHVPSMQFGDYLDWFYRSAAHLTPEGKLLPDTQAQVDTFLTVWKDQEEAVQRRGVFRALQVHPRHHDVFAAAITAFHADRAPVTPAPETAALATPRPRSRPAP
jgi:hypothetical protein